MQTKTTARIAAAPCRRTFVLGRDDERKTASAWLRTLQSKARHSKTLGWYYTALYNTLARVYDADLLEARPGLEDALLVLSNTAEIQP